jgi:hypothetical protein
MASATTRALLAAATLMGGILAGVDVDRATVIMPAWQQVGPEAWAVFSRQADLGNGLILYPLEAIGGALLALAAAVSFRSDRSASRASAFPIYAAVILALAGLAITLKAAPVMLGIRQTTDVAALRSALEDFHFWGNMRGLCQVLAFFILVWALSTIAPAAPPR